MQINELFETLKKEFPENLSDVLEGLTYYKFTLDDTMDLIYKKRGEAFKKRDFEEDERLTKMAKELYQYICKVDTLTKILEEDELEVENDMDEETEKKVIPNYAKYLVDDTAPHSLYEDFKHIRPKAFEIDGNKIEANTFKEMLGKTCTYLMQKDKDLMYSFENNPNMNGKKNKYFSRSINEIKGAPYEITDDYFIETRMSGNCIKNLIMKIIRKYGYKITDYKVYFRADYTKLNEKR